jgi:disulfide bond formation protein DsbB
LGSLEESGLKSGSSFAVAVATSLPLQIWLVMWLRGFGLEAESARFGFYVGLSMAAWATPLCLVASVIGCWLSIRSGRRQV